MTVLRLAALLTLLAAPLFAQSGQAVARAEERGFMALATFVLDKDWREKWEPPRETSPVFQPANTVTPDDEPTLLLFFSPPDFSVSPQKLTCSLAIFEDDILVQDIPTAPCFEKDLQGAASDIFLAFYISGVSFDTEDIGKRIRFDLEVGDPDRGIVLPVSVRTDVVKDRSQ